MQQEDDLRGLARVMDFMRGIAFLFMAIHLYWFCYEWMHSMDWTLGIVDKILGNFHRTTGLFSSTLYTKLFCFVFLALSCLGNKGVKHEKITWGHIITVGLLGLVLFFGNDWLLAINREVTVRTWLYIITLVMGFFCLLAAGLWMSRILKNRLLDDVFKTN